MWSILLGLTSTRVTPWGPVLLEQHAKGAGMEMGLMEELSPALKPVHGMCLQGCREPTGWDGTVMGVRGAAGTGAHTATLRLFKLLPALQEEASSLLPCCQLVFFLCFYRKSQFPQIIQLRVRKKKIQTCHCIFFPSSSLSHTQGLKAH